MPKPSPAVFGGIPATALREYVDQIEQIEREIQALNLDKSEIYQAAKHAGADLHVLKWVINERRKERKTPGRRRAMGLLFSHYWTAVHGPADEGKNFHPGLDSPEDRAIARSVSNPAQIELEDVIEAAVREEEAA